MKKKKHFVLLKRLRKQLKNRTAGTNKRRMRKKRKRMRKIQPIETKWRKKCTHTQQTKNKIIWKKKKHKTRKKKFIFKVKRISNSSRWSVRFIFFYLFNIYVVLFFLSFLRRRFISFSFSRFRAELLLRNFSTFALCASFVRAQSLTCPFVRSLSLVLSQFITYLYMSMLSYVNWI